MKGLRRFQARGPDEEVPREVFQAVADDLGRSFAEEGWRYARSGPHISRTQANVRFIFHFASDALNTAGQLVAFYVHYTIHDKAMATWRESEGFPVGADRMVARSHIGALLPRPSATQWNLADARSRTDVADDIEATIRSHGLGFASSVFETFSQPVPSTTALRPLLNDLELAEYLIRFGRIEAAREVVREHLLRLPSRRRQWYLAYTQRLWEGGLSPEPDFSGIVSPRDALTWTKLPYLVVRYELATESELTAWTQATDE